MDKFHLKIIWLLLSLLSLANSLSLEEREAILEEHGCKGDECEVIEVEFSSRRKRSVDSRFSFPLKAFGRERTLNLQLSSGILVGQNTPVYYAQSRSNIQKTTYQSVSSLVRSQFYEDKANLAAFTIDTESDIPKIKHGIVHSENLTIIPLNSSKNSSDGSPRQYYLAKYSLSDLVNDIFGYSSFRKRHTPVPSLVYPEILVVIDYGLVELYGSSIFQHTIDLWNQIDAVYRPLQNPSFKLSIAGFLIPQSRGVFNSLYGYNSIDYNDVLPEMSSWLRDAHHSIPFNGYDVHMVMTNRRHYDGMTLGLTTVGSACTGVQTNLPLGGVFLDDQTDYKSYVTGAHELGHALGLNHDDASVLLVFNYPSGKLMGSSRGGKEWSQKSKQEMQQVMRDADFSCLENSPNAGSISTSYPAPNYNYQGNGISPPKTNNPGWSFGSGSNGFNTDLRPADIDSGYSFGTIGSNNFKPPATKNNAWLPDFNTNNNQDLVPKNPYSEYSNDNNNNNNDYGWGGLFSYNYDYSYY